MLAGLGRSHDWVADGPSMGAGMPRWRGVAATDVVTGQAAAKMHPAPADSEAITAGGLEAAGHWGQRSGVEMGATSHRPVPFFRANLVPRATLASHLSRAQLVRPNKVADYAGNSRHNPARSFSSRRSSPSSQAGLPAAA